jgi:glutathione-regulated potassium-efflux system ancillary protein KefC/glutathione-regulated potassium-efflux system protein KefB
MSLGAFLAGVLLADSEFRHEIEAELEPFKGLLLGLFFIAVGMSVNLGLIGEQVWLLAGLAVALILTKFAVLYLIGRLAGCRGDTPRNLGIALAAGGEFAFVLFDLAREHRIVASETAETLVMVITLSMMLAPLLFLLNDTVLKRWAARHEEPEYDRIDEPANPVVIAGFGRFGQIIARILASMQIPFTALDASPVQVDFVRQFGNKIYYGDARRLDLLRAARIDKARVFVLAVDDVESSVQIAETVKSHFPHLKLYARARNRQHEMHLKSLGVDAIIRETLLSSLYLAEQVLIGLGLSAADARRAAEIFRRHDQETLERQLAIRDDREALIESSKDSARQLKALFEADAQARRSDQESAAGRDPLANRMRD